MSSTETETESDNEVDDISTSNIVIFFKIISGVSNKFLILLSIVLTILPFVLYHIDKNTFLTLLWPFFLSGGIGVIIFIFFKGGKPILELIYGVGSFITLFYLLLFKDIANELTNYQKYQYSIHFLTTPMVNF
jgi:hypothetical protein